MDLKKKSSLSPTDPTLIRFHIYQHDIRTDPANTAPGDHIVLISSKQTKKTARPGNHNGKDIPLGNLHLYVCDKAQPSAIADTDHFFALQLRKFNGHTLPLLGKGYARFKFNMSYYQP